MTKKRDPKSRIPSFSEVTAKPQHPETKARLHPSALPQEKAPGSLREVPMDPARNWLQELARTPSALADRVFAMLEPLRSEEYRKALRTEYVAYCRTVERIEQGSVSTYEPGDDTCEFDFSTLFEEPAKK